MTEDNKNIENSNLEGHNGHRKVNKTITLVLKSAPLVIALIALLFSLWNMYSVRKSIAELEWADAVASDSASADSIVPEVGTIQFLKNGYSVELESVSYNANGLYMSGYIGNPKLLWLSNLTVQFTAQHPFYSARSAFMKASPNSVDRFLASPEQIGTAQTKPISSLSPRMREHFEVTIPNVKQTKDRVEIRVSFTGERYSYGP